MVKKSEGFKKNKFLEGGKLKMTTLENMNYINTDSAFFRAIHGYRGRYYVSLDGQVYSLVSYRFLKPHIGSSGYPMVTLTHPNGEQQTYTVHSLVASAFVQGRQAGLEVNHIDGDKTNNFFANLEWVSREENLQHAVRNGLRKTKYEVRDMIKELYALGLYTQIQIAKLVGLSQAQISNITNDKVYNY